MTPEEKNACLRELAAYGKRNHAAFPKTWPADGTPECLDFVFRTLHLADSSFLVHRETLQKWLMTAPWSVGVDLSPRNALGDDFFDRALQILPLAMLQPFVVRFAPQISMEGAAAGQSRLLKALAHPESRRRERAAMTLIEAGASINATNGAGRTPLMVALGKNTVCLPVAHRLLDMGCDVGVKDNKGNTALGFARMLGKTPGAPAMVEKIRVLETARHLEQLLPATDPTPGQPRTPRL